MNILRPLDIIPCDKLKHGIIGAFVMMGAMLFTSSALVLAGVIISVAYGIEITQKVFKWGKFEHLDALAVIVGGAIIYLWSTYGT